MYMPCALGIFVPFMYRLSLLRTLLLAFALFAGFTSCEKKCCDCSKSEIYEKDICEDQLPAGFTSWEVCRDAMQDGGCVCSE
jgi:hypothetical protein